MAEEEIAQIVKQLLSEPNLKENWTRLYFGINSMIIIEPTKLIEESNGLEPQDLLAASITKWMAQNGKDKEAQIENFLRMLEALGFKAAADSLSHDFRNENILELAPPEEIPDSKTQSPTPPRVTWPLSYNINDSIKYFVSRKSELDQLLEHFKSGKNKIVLISGIAGIGKTSLTRKFAKMATLGYDASSTLVDSKPTGFQASITELTWQLNVSLVKTKSMRQLTDILNDLTSAILPNTPKWILIVDNLGKQGNNENFFQVLEILSKMEHVFILITSRDSNILGQTKLSYTHMPLRRFELADSTDLVWSSLESNEDKATLQKLCDLVQNFPLSLQTAIAYIKQQRKDGGMYTVDNYIKEYRTCLPDVPKLTSEYEKSILVTFYISFAKLGIPSRILLRILAYVDSSGISESYLKLIFEKYLEEPMTKFDTAISQLRMHHLVNVADSTVCIPQPFQTAIRSNPGLFGDVESEFFRKLIPTIIPSIQDLTKADLTSVSLILDYASKYKDIIEDYKDIPRKLADQLFSCGMYEAGLEFSKKFLGFLQVVLGERDDETVMMNIRVVKFMKANRLKKEALEMLEMVYQNAFSWFGPEYDLTILVASDLAGIYADLDQFDKAMALYQQVLESYQRVFGEDHKNTNTIRGNMADLLQVSSKNLEAIALYKPYLEWQQVKFGKEDPDTLATMHRLGVCLRRVGKYTEGKFMLEAALHLQSKVLGSEAVNTLLTKASLAITFANLGEVEKSLDMLKEVLEVQERVLGKEHKRTKWTMSEIETVRRKHGGNCTIS